MATARPAPWHHPAATGCAPLAARLMAAAGRLASRLVAHRAPGLHPRCPLDARFRLVPATTPALREAVYRIRHAVYVDEFGWERDAGDGRALECDGFDRHARHLLLQGPGDRPVGTLRVVFDHPGTGTRALPLEDCCLDSIPGPARDRLLNASARAAEVSRIALLPAFRRHAAQQRGNDATDAALCLYLGAAAVVRCAGLPGAFGVLHPRHARRIRRLGFPVVQVGRVLEHHGPRAVYYLPAEDLERTLAPPLAALLRRCQHRLQGAGWCSGRPP